MIVTNKQDAYPICQPIPLHRNRNAVTTNLLKPKQKKWQGGMGVKLSFRCVCDRCFCRCGGASHILCIVCGPIVERPDDPTVQRCHQQKARTQNCSLSGVGVYTFTPSIKGTGETHKTPQGN